MPYFSFKRGPNGGVSPPSVFSGSFYGIEKRRAVATTHHERKVKETPQVVCWAVKPKDNEHFGAVTGRSVEFCKKNEGFIVS